MFLRLANLLPPVNDPEQPWLNTLNVTLFDLAPNWEVTQIYPPDESPAFTLSPGLYKDLPLQASLPEGYDRGTDILKVFATLGTSTTSFRWFELPPLDHPVAEKTRSARGAAKPTTLLERMLDSVVGDKPIMRNVSSTTSPGENWTTAQVELRVERLASA